ncbi:MAG TPA: deoxyribonuclease IV [Thermoanaerobaculia bacterium]|nr:deoxyribonuclease IV [Thermoanaerobaculia bacterium]
MQAVLPPLGTHVSVAGGLSTAFGRAADLGCDAMQIFVKNASQWRGKEMLDGEIAAFREAHVGSAVGPLMAHGSYLINLAATDPVILEKSLDALTDELVRCSRLGVAGLVLHPGAHLGAGEEAGIDKVAAALDAVLGDLPDVSTRVLLENTAGQGSCLGWRLEQLAAIRERVAEPLRVGFCLDTCHAFAAGYAIHEEAGFADFLSEVDERLGLATVSCFHINDSVRPFASRRDRHAHIGEGEIGLAMFERMLTEPRIHEIPMVVETEPGDDMEYHRQDLEVLRGLVGLGKKKKRKSRASSPTGRSAG